MNFAESFSSSDLADIGGPAQVCKRSVGDWLSCGFFNFLVQVI